MKKRLPHEPVCNTGREISMTTGSDRPTRWSWIHVAAMAVTLVFSMDTGSFASEKRMQSVIKNLVDSYNAVDSIGYIRDYSRDMAAENSLSDVGESLRRGASSLGRIESHSARISEDGRRALLVVHTESSTYDVHLRLNPQGMLERDDWMPHKTDPADRMSLSDLEEADLRARYTPVLTSWVEAVRTDDAALFYSLFTPAVSEDDMSLEDAKDMLARFRRRGDINRVGEIEITEPGEALLPLFFERMDLAIYFNFSSDDLIDMIRMTNYAPVESEGKTLADIGGDTVRTSDLVDFSEFRQRFNSDSGKTRLIALLSPT